MAVLHHAVILQGASGLPEDATINNLYTDGPGIATLEAPLAQQNLVDFWNVATAEHPTLDMAAIISAGVSRAALASTVRTWTVSTADGSETFHSELPFTLGGAAIAEGLPQEVAIVISFNGIQDGSALDARRRGRIFVGPLTTTTSDDTTFPVRPDQTVIDMLANNANRLIADMQADAMDWVVWSRTGLFTSPVDSGYVDNAFDTQRRRGVAPSARTPFPAA